MNRRKGILIALGVVVVIVGCTLVLRPTSKTKEISKDEVVKEVDNDKVTKNKEETLAKLLEGKYLYDDSGDSEIGTVFCFNKNEVIALYTYEADVNKIKKTSSDANKALFELESNEHGSPEIIIKSKLKIEKTSDTSVTLSWSSNDAPARLSKSLKILTAEECVKAIAKAHPDYVHDQNWDELGLTKELFAKVFGSVQTNSNSDANSMSPEKALQLCKNKLSGFLNPEHLTLSKNIPGLPSAGKYNGARYIYVYYMIDGIAGDYRYCVKESDGSIYYEDSANMGKLIDIDTYIANNTSESKSNDANKSTSNNDSSSEEKEAKSERTKISESEALSLCEQKVKDIGWYSDDYGDSYINGVIYDDYYHVQYMGGEGFAVNMFTGEVHYAAPAGDGLSGPL